MLLLLVAGTATVPAASADDLFRDPGWQDPVLPHGMQQASPSGMYTMQGSFQPPAGAGLPNGAEAAASGLDDFFGAPARPASTVPKLAPKLAPPPSGVHAVQFGGKATSAAAQPQQPSGMNTSLI